MEQGSREDDLIARYFAPLAGEGGLGLRDDAALFRPEAGRDLVLTTDALVAGVHFFSQDPAGAVAQKALRVNLSDIAAKGARAEGFLLALSLPCDWRKAEREDWLAAFAAGLAHDARFYECPLLGGDTVSTDGPLTLAITALGSVAQDGMVQRTGARPGDQLYVSGTIGDAALGLVLRNGSLAAVGLSKTSREALLERYLLPQPRIKMAAALGCFASGAMDISDGLVGDLSKMMRVSGVSAEIDIDAIPLSAAAREMIGLRGDWLETALTGGDDYEILASVPPLKSGAFEAAARAAGVVVQRIGVAIAGRDAPLLRGKDGRPMHFSRSSFQHF